MSLGALGATRAYLSAQAPGHDAPMYLFKQVADNGPGQYSGSRCSQLGALAQRSLETATYSAILTYHSVTPGRLKRA